MSRRPDSYAPTDPTVLLTRARIRSAALRRRRLGVGGGATLAVVLALVLTLVGAAGSGSPHRPTGRLFVAARVGAAQELTADVARADKASPRARGAVARAEVGLSLRLLDQLAAHGNSGNVLVSPSSLTTALAMLELGSAGRTERQIAATLGTAGLTPALEASAWDALVGLLAAETSTSASRLRSLPQLDIANGLWVQQSFPIKRPFVDELASEFGTGIWQADFVGHLDAATGALNVWASRHTHGLIKQMFSPGTLNAYTRLVLANAVYFHARWAQSFATKQSPGAFYLPSGSTETVRYMRPANKSHQMTVPNGTWRGATTVELPYAGKRISALVVMPEHQSLPAYVRALKAASVTALVKHLRSTPVDLEMPSFTLSSGNKLNSALGAMGMPLAFSGGADLSRISSLPLYVQAVEQHAYLQVTPRGTTAAAVTGVSVALSSTKLGLLEIDHPFLFLIRDDTTGAVLFEAMVENPLG